MSIYQQMSLKVATVNDKRSRSFESSQKTLVFTPFFRLNQRKSIKMSRICALPLTLRLHMVKKLQINTSNRSLCISSRFPTNNLTSKSQSEFHHQAPTLFDSRKFYTPPIQAHIAWRGYGTQTSPPNSNNRPASSGNDDDDHLYGDEDLAVFDEDEDDDIDAEMYRSDDEKSVPSVNTVPDYFPKVPMIATSYPVFPKFMKVFEVTDPNLIKLLEWVRLKMK